MNRMLLLTIPAFCVGALLLTLAVSIARSSADAADPAAASIAARGADLADAAPEGAQRRKARSARDAIAIPYFSFSRGPGRGRS